MSSSDESSDSESNEIHRSRPLIFPIKRRKWICILDHPTKVKVNYHLNIKVLSGGITILGHEINTHTSSFDIFSFKKFFYLQIITQYSENLLHNRSPLRELYNQLISLDKEMASTILDHCTNFSVVLLIQNVENNLTLDLLRYYSPIFRHNSKYIHNHGNEMLSEVLSTNFLTDVIYLPQNKIVMGSRIVKAIISKVTQSEVARIMFYGSPNTGKSIFVQFLINSLLKKLDEIYYLDCDNGYPEFLPPGCIGLTRIVNPLLGPSFMHLTTPVEAYYLASTKTNYHIRYIKCIQSAMNAYLKDCSSKVLFINTIGCSEDIDNKALKCIMEITKPTIMVELVPEGKNSIYLHLQFQDGIVLYYHIRSYIYKSKIDPTKLRNLSTLASLSGCIKEYWKPDLLNVIPYRLNWKNYACYIYAVPKMDQENIFESLITAYVALCFANDYSDVFEHGDSPKILENIPQNVCLGFGIIRALDYKKQCYCITTPLSPVDLDQVNLLIKGELDVPPELFVNQVGRLDNAAFYQKTFKRIAFLL